MKAVYNFHLPPFLTRFHFASTPSRTIQFSKHHCRIPTSCNLQKPISTNSTRFNWYEQWYPLTFLQDLSPTRPTSLTILSQPLVIWQDNDENWQVFHDRCPHRFAALSQGRIDTETGMLECGYHGWQFNSSGQVSRIPQWDNGSIEPSSTLCATRVPTCIHDGLLFVWLGRTPPSKDQLPALGTIPMTGSSYDRYTRELPLQFTTLLQNVLDPAHIHFAHHGQIGRREDAKNIPMRVVQPVYEQGFGMDYYEGRVLTRFRAPCMVEIRNCNGDSFVYYAVPIGKDGVRTLAIRRKKWWWPVWVGHVWRNWVVETDLEMMKSQQGAGEWKAWKLMTESDRLVAMLRHWISAYGVDEWDAVQVAGSRWHSHTEKCAQCKGAWNALTVLERVFWGVGFVLVVASGGTNTGIVLGVVMMVLARVVRRVRALLE